MFGKLRVVVEHNVPTPYLKVTFTMNLSVKVFLEVSNHIIPFTYPISYYCEVQDCGSHLAHLAHQGVYVDRASAIARRQCRNGNIRPR